MKRTAAICLAFIAGSMMMAAQAVEPSPSQSSGMAQSEPLNQYHPQKFSPQAPQSQSVLVVGAGPSGCPVLFSAKQGWDGGFVAAGPRNVPKDGFSQRIRLSLTDSKVIAARVTVHGLTPKRRVMPVQPGASGPAQINRTMNIGFSSDSAGESAADLLLRGYTAVFSIDVDSITYADGSTWKSSQGMCRVVPDPMMLIGSF